VQDSRHVAPEALGHALASRPWTGGQTIRALIKSGLFDQSWAALMGAQCGPANDNIGPPENLATTA